MADPVSVSASIAGLVTLADIVFIRAVKYIKAAKGATNEVKLLCDSLQSLSGALHSLSLFAARLDAETDADDYHADYRPRLVQSCAQLLGEIRKKLERHDPSEPGLSRAYSALRQFKWPFATQEVKDILEKIEQHKSALMLALSADTFQALQDVLSAHRSFQDDLAEIKSAIAEQRRTFEAHLSTLYSEKEQRDIYDFFGSESPEDRHRTNMRLRHPETGLWLLDDDDFIAWIDGRSPKLWITGIPGAGKTVLASVIIEEALSRVEIGRVAVAYFYCDYKDTNSQDPVKILGSIATQLAQQSVEAFELLQKLYKDYHPVSRMSRSPEASSLVDAIRQMCGFFEDIHLIVDGLDECGDHAREVTRFLRRTDQFTKSGKDAKIALLSRSEEVIRQQLEKEYVHVQISARSEDLRLYVAAEMESRIIDGRLDLSSAGMRDEILKALVEGADGMFRWVACQMDYLCEQSNDYDIRGALRSLPPSLDASYSRVLERVNSRSVQIQALVQRTLRWLTYGPRQLGEVALCVAVSISEHMTHLDPTRQPTIRAIMTHCSSLVRRSPDTDRIELAHFTVKEFLTAGGMLDIPALAPYVMTEEASMFEMAKAFVTYATFPEFDQPLFRDYAQWSTWMSQFPFRRVAIERLVQYAREQWLDAFIFGKMKELFQPPKSKRFLRFAQDYMLLMMDMSADVMDQVLLNASWFQGMTELHLAAYVENAPLCNWLIEGGCSVNDIGSLGSPLHWVLLGEQAIQIRCWRKIKDDPNYPMLRINSRTLDVLRIIVDAGANGRCRFLDAGGTDHSPLSLVRNPVQEKSRVDEVVRLLLSAGAQADEQFLDIMDKVRKVGRTQQVRAILDCLQTQDIEDSCKHRFVHLCNLVKSHSPTRWKHLEDSHHFSSEQTLGSSIDVELLHYASIMDDSGTIREILDARLVDVDSTTSEHGETALHVAVEQGSNSSARVLLEYGAKVSRRNARGENALHKCAMIRGESIVSLLLDQGANPDDLDVDECTIYHLAARQNNVNVLRVLLKHHSFAKSSLEKRNSSGLTPILAAAGDFAEDCLSLLLSVSDDLSGVEATTGWGMIHFSVFLSLQSFNSVLSTKIDVGLLDQESRSALHLCFQYEISDAVEKARVLIERGLDVCSVDKAGNTAAHLLLIKPEWQEESDLISLLTLAITTISVGLEDAEGNTPLLLFLRHPFVKSKTVLALRKILYHAPDITTLGRTGKSSVEVLLESESCFGRLFEDLSQIADIFLELINRLDGAELLSNEGLASRALAWALWGRQDTLADRLLDHAGDVSTPIPGHNGNSLLEICIDGQASVSLLRRLIAKSPEQAVSGAFRRTERTLVHICCENQSETNIEQLEELIAAGTDINAACQPKRYTALILAARMGKTKHIQVLLSHGADAMKTGAGNWNALHFAASRKSPEALKAFRPFDVGKLSPVNIYLAKPNYIFPGSTFAHLVSFHVAVLEYVLSQSDPIDLDSRNPKGQTPLHLASIANNVESGRYLLSQGVEIDARDDSGKTPLHFACMYGWVPIVKLLISNGTDIDAQDKEGRTPLHYTAEHGFEDIVQTLIQNGCKHFLDSSGCPPERLALIHEHTEIASVLREARTTEIDQRAYVSGAFTVLSDAILAGDRGTVIQLLDCGISTDYSHDHCCGCSSLLVALEAKNLDLVDLFIGRGVEVGGERCSYSAYPGASSVHLAARNDSLTGALHTILSKSTNGDLHLGHAIHPLHFAVARQNNAGLKLLLQHYLGMDDESFTNLSKDPRIPYSGVNSPVRLILNVSISCNNNRGPYKIFKHLSADDLDGCSPLHVAAIVGNEEAAHILINLGANVESRDWQLQTPLHIAAGAGSIPVLKHLLVCGANPQSYDAYEVTPALRAVSNGELEAFIALEQYGLDIGGSAITENRFLEVSLRSSSGEILAYLLQKGYRQTPNPFGVFILSDAWRFVTGAGFASLVLNSQLVMGVYANHIWHLGSKEISNDARSSLFKKLLKRIPSDSAALRTISTKRNTTDTDSPLCYAAMRGQKQVTDLLISFGADVNVHGCKFGPPLMAACKTGHLPVVAILIRRGAEMTYFDGRNVNSAVQSAGHFPQIQHWLLVERFTEQRKISHGSDELDQAVKGHWAGLQAFRIPLTRQFGRFGGESTLDHACRLSRLRREFEGEVLSWPAGAEHPFICLQ